MQHEIVFVFSAGFADVAAYEVLEQQILDARGPTRVIWRAPDTATPPLYPDGVAAPAQARPRRHRPSVRSRAAPQHRRTAPPHARPACPGCGQAHPARPPTSSPPATPGPGPHSPCLTFCPAGTSSAHPPASARPTPAPVLTILAGTPYSHARATLIARCQSRTAIPQRPPSPAPRTTRISSPPTSADTSHTHTRILYPDRSGHR